MNNRRDTRKLKYLKHSKRGGVNASLCSVCTGGADKHQPIGRYNFSINECRGAKLFRIHIVVSRRRVSRVNIFAPPAQISSIR